MNATILFGHGSRDPIWRNAIDRVARRILELNPDSQVRCAFLELTEPDLPSAVSELVSLSATVITVLPMFLGVGKHAREDLPLLIARLEERFQSVKFVVKPSVGEVPEVIDLVARLAIS